MSNVMENIRRKRYNLPSRTIKYDPELNAVGIDLGTTESCAAVIRKNGADFVVLDKLTALRNLPSYVVYDEDHEKCGQIAVNRIRNKSKFVVFDSKRLLGRNFEEIIIDPSWPFIITQPDANIKIGDETKYITKMPEEVSGALLKHIKKEVDEYQGKVTEEVVIAIPSDFSLNQREATIKAAKQAGWETINFIAEPIAAAFAYCKEMNIRSNSKILLFDCGGGTIDVCVAEVTSDHLTVLSYDGDSYLGGRDFDNLLVNYFSGILKNKFNISILDGIKKCVLVEKCKEIKCTLSVEEEFWLDVNDFDPNNENDIIPITRKDLETMAESYKVRIMRVIFQSLEKAKVQRDEINYVFQVGGGCRMPMIKNILSDIFPDADHQYSLYTDWVVAHGAALYAYSLKCGDSLTSECFAEENVESYVIPEKLSNYDQSLNAVAINFGTTNCCAAIVRKNGSAFLPLGDHDERFLPSHVSFYNNTTIYGTKALKMYQYSFYDIKNILRKHYEEIKINSSWPFKVEKTKNGVLLEVNTDNGKIKISPEEAAALLLKHIKTRLSEYQGTVVKDAVITIPLNFTIKQKTSLMMAAKLAGWENVHFIPKTIAATFACLEEEKIKNHSNTLIFNFGDVITDVTVVKITNKRLNIMDNQNESFLGGRDFDTLLFNYWAAILDHKYNVKVLENSRQTAKLLEECRRMKEDLSEKNNTCIYIGFFKHDTNDLLPEEITYKRFEEMASDLIFRIQQLIFRALAKSKLQKDQINHVFQVGGGCRMPMIKKILEETFQTAVKQQYDSFLDIEFVGSAALYAYQLKCEAMKEDISVKHKKIEVESDENFSRSFENNVSDKESDSENEEKQGPSLNQNTQKNIVGEDDDDDREKQNHESDGIVSDLVRRLCCCRSQ